MSGFIVSTMSLSSRNVMNSAVFAKLSTMTRCYD
eukprot:UN08650